MTTVTFQTNSIDAMRLYSMIQSYGVETIEIKEDTDDEVLDKELQTAISLDELEQVMKDEIKQLYRDKK